MKDEKHCEAPAEGLRERKKRESRDAMHRAALELVAAKGLAEVTVDEIAERAQVSPRTLFNYWGSKEAAVIGIMPRDNQRLIDVLRERPASEDPRTSMLEVLKANLEHATPDRSIRKLKRNVLRREPQLSQVFMNRNNDVQRELIEILAERLAAGMDHETAYDLAAMHVFWCFGMSRAVYAMSMKRDIDLMKALPIMLDHVRSGRITL